MKSKDKVIIVLAIFLIFAILSWIIPAAYFQGTLQGYDGDSR